MELVKNRKSAPWKSLLAVSLIRGVAGPGLNSSLGVFFPSVAAMLGVGVGTIAWSVSIASLAGMLFLPLADRVFSALGIRRTALIGVLSVALSFLSLGFATHIIWWFILAVPFGIGTVLVVNMLGPLVLDRQAEAEFGSALGIMMTIAGVAAIPVQPLAAWAIARGGVRMGYFLAGGVSLLFMLPCVWVLPREGIAVRGRRETKTSAAMPFRLLLLLFMLLLVIVGYNAFHQHLAVLGKNASLSEGMVGVALAMSAFGAAVGGVLIGGVTHRFGGVAGGYLTLGIGVIAVLLFMMGAPIGWLFSLAAFLHGVASSAIGITTQALARERDEAGYGHTLSRLLTAIPLANIIFTPLWGMIYDRTAQYTLALWGMLGLLAVGAGCLWLFSRSRTKDPSM